MQAEENPCGTRKRKHFVPESLLSMSVRDMRAQLSREERARLKTGRREELCDVLRQKKTPASLRVRLGFLRNDGRNSCYMDALVTSLFHRRNAWLENIVFRKPLDPKLAAPAQDVRQALLEVQRRVLGKATEAPTPSGCRNLRKSLKAFDAAYDKGRTGREAVEWMRTQLEPLDVVSALLRVFPFPSNAILQQTSNHKHVAATLTRAPFNALSIDAGDLYGKKVVHMQHFVPRRREHRGGRRIDVIELVRAPPMLLVSVMRAFLEEQKLTTAVVPLPELHVPGAHLECVSILLHHGLRADAGHYTAMIKAAHNQLWYHYDDLGSYYQLVGYWKDVLQWRERFVLRNCVGFVYVRARATPKGT